MAHDEFLTIFNDLGRMALTAGRTDLHRIATVIAFSIYFKNEASLAAMIDRWVKMVMPEIIRDNPSVADRLKIARSQQNNTESSNWSGSTVR
jgi:hypothetical protein